MKIKAYGCRIVPVSLIRHVGAVLVALALAGTAINVHAQGGTVTISGADFQRLVYAAHLHTQLAAKPELEASLQVLVDMQRRNPAAPLAALTDLSRQALQRYRTNTPAYIRTNGFRDEILAAYLDALRQVPAHTNFIPVNLTLLHYLMLGSDDYYNPTLTPLDLINSANKRLSSSEGRAAKRQILANNFVALAGNNSAAVDSLLLPETQVSLADTPAEIIGNTNSPLHDNLTMNLLLLLCPANGSLTVSTNLLRNLFANEMQTIWDTIHTNLAVLAQIHQSQTDLLAYLTNQAAIDANVQLQTAAQQGQPARIASSTAAVLVQSELLPVDAESAEIETTVSAIADIGIGIAGLCNEEMLGLDSLMSGGLELFNLFSGAQSPQDVMANQISNIQTLVEDLSVNMNYRFDRVDQSLATIYDTMNQAFTNITITLDAQGHQIAQINGNVNDIRSSLVTAQASLNRLESEMFADFSAAQNQDIIMKVNQDLLYGTRHPDLDPIGLNQYLDAEGTFYSYATSLAENPISSPTFSPGSLPPLQSQLANFPLDANLNYIKTFLSARLGQNTAGSTPLSNPEEWFISAYAYLQLAVENPMWFRKAGSLDAYPIIARGQNLTNFCGSLTFSGTNVNWPLYTALENHYLTNLIAFNAQVAAFEGAYATNHDFALGTWRQWDSAAPRVEASATKVLCAPVIPSSFPHESAKSIAAGGSFSLVLTSNRTVVGWGDNSHGQITSLDGLTNVTRLAAGDGFSLALKSDGTVVGWGNNSSSQTNIPGGLTNVAAIAAGAEYGLALKTDGTVFGWGQNYSGQATGVPRPSPPFTGQGLVTVGGQILSNVVAVAAGQAHSLVLLPDGTVFGWGANSYGEATGVPSTLIPPFGFGLVTVASQTLSNVVKIAAGGHFSLALKTNKTVVGWGDNSHGQTDVPAGLTNVTAIAAGEAFGLALKADGTVVAWGDNSHGQTNIPSGLTNVVAIAAGASHSLAIKANGTVVAWGNNGNGQTSVPVGLTKVAWRGAIAAGRGFILALKDDGAVVGWGYDGSGETSIPAGLTNVAAVAAGSSHSLALKANGSVVAWGNNGYGQTSVPAGLTNAVAIAAGDHHSLALKADGTVVGWGGDNVYGQTNIPAGLTNVVGIAGGFWHSLALKADGTVVGWGYNPHGEATGVPNTVSPYFSSGPVTISGHLLTNVTAIAAGFLYSLALKADGTVVAWGDDVFGQTNVPPNLTNVVGIAGGLHHSLALKADGTVVGWGGGGDTAAFPTGVTNVAAIAAGVGFSVVAQADGTIVGRGWNFVSPPAVPSGLTNAVAVAAGGAYGLALKPDGTVVGWGGDSFYNQIIEIPNYLTNVAAIAAGAGHGLALKTDGTVVAWGSDYFGTIHPPSGLGNVVAIAAGSENSLALKADGTVVAWGNNSSGQTNVPLGLLNVLAIAAGGNHNLALKANGTVVAWGDNSHGQTTIPASLANTVAIAAGSAHSLALKADGTVVAWGDGSYGQTNVPFGLSRVVAISAGANSCMALKADGTVVAWGNYCALPDGLTNVVAIADGDGISLFLTTADSGGNTGSGSLSFIRAPIPARVPPLLLGCVQNTIQELGLTGSALDTAAAQLTGAKMLLADVLELGMPYTLAHDDILHGFFYGSESLTDTSIATDFLQTQNTLLQTSPYAPPRALVERDWQSYLRFQDRLNLCLTNLQAAGRPEIPRLVGHTLRLLNLLCDSWTQPTNSPRPALEIWSEGSSPRLLLYGEPFMRYTLQYRDTLSVPGWTTTTVTNLQDEQIIIPPFSGTPQRFYRTLLPTP